MQINIHKLKDALGLFSALAPSSRSFEAAGTLGFFSLSAVGFVTDTWRGVPHRPASATGNDFSISLGFCTLTGGFSVTSAAVPAR